jgi:hypothetical protein
MAEVKDILNYLQQSTRNKIVFCRDYMDDIAFINVGRELSQLLGEHPQEISGFETMYKQVLNASSYNDKIGLYLAIENIGILFEPELKLDLRSVINNYSKNQCLIIKTEAAIQNDTLYFLDETDTIHVNLQGLSYKLI